MTLTALRAVPQEPRAALSDSSLRDGFAGLASGNLEIRLARTDDEVHAAQRLRYRVFYEEMSAHPTAEMAATGRDFDSFDGVADHLLVLDNDLDGDDRVVGTYRLMRREGADKIGRFYTSGEYAIEKLVASQGEILELGRSCVAEPYRCRRVMDLLWRGVGAYVMRYDIQYMFGCASFPCIDHDAVALPLSYLHHHHLAPEAIRPIANADRQVAMDRLPKDAFSAKAGFVSVPPLVKGYIRLGGFVGDGAVIDPQFNTIDVCVVVKTALVTARYLNRYNRQ